MVPKEEEVRSQSSLDPIEVVALVGPSGTGKSHNAMVVSQEWACKAIIDDGLLISESRILAGRSAKREETRPAAVRRAVFLDPAHALEVRNVLETLAPCRILILGTSVPMVARIISRLDLPEPLRILQIEEFVTPDEIDVARWHRRQEGRHVIPAPSFEVKKTFSGYLVDPLQMFVRSREQRYVSTEKSVVRPTYSYFGHFYISDAVVMQMAQRICLDVPGVKRVQKTLVLSTGDGAFLLVELVLEYGVKVFEVMAQVQSNLKERLEYLTGIYLLEVEVSTRKISLE